MDYGIWYDDGKIDIGWVHDERGNGRTSRYETPDREDAEAQAATLRSVVPWQTFSVEELDGNHGERFKRVRKLALERRLEEAEKVVRQLRDALGHYR